MKFNSLQALALTASLLSTGLAHASLINLALDKPATASSSYEQNGYALAKGNDGDLNTIWNGGAWGAWWQVDLQSALSVDRIVVNAMDGPGYHIHFEVEESLDGSVWDVVGNDVGTGNPWSFTYNTPGLTTRFIRYTTFAEGGSDWATLAELQAIGTQGSTTVPEPATVWLTLAALIGVGASRKANGRTRGRLARIFDQMMRRGGFAV
jgi:hypothetical protein